MVYPGIVGGYYAVWGATPDYTGTATPNPNQRFVLLYQYNQSPLSSGDLTTP